MDVTRIAPDRSGDVVEALCDAFRDYPVMRYILADAGPDYDVRLRDLVGYFTERRFLLGYPVLGVVEPDGGRLVAAANLDPPRRVPSTPAVTERFQALRGALGEASIGRFEAFANAIEDLEPDVPHYGLGMIGVTGDGQGQGHARRLLDAIHDLSSRDRHSTGVCLTTELRRNVELYEHFGYRVLGHATTDDGELETWTMFREDPS